MPAPAAQTPHRDPPAHPDGHKDEYSWVSALAFAFLTYNTFNAAYRSLNDPWALSFILAAYFDLVGLFWCLRLFERSTEPSKEKLKVAVWILATILTVMFSYKVASIMPLPIAAVVWCMGSATTLGGFYAFFIYREPSLKN